jgi:hypothetical protein
MDDRARFCAAGIAAHNQAMRWTLDFGAGNATLTVTCEGSMDGKSWAPPFEGKATKK